MKNLYPLCAAVVLAIACACNKVPAAEPLVPSEATVNVIPYPNQISIYEGGFDMSGVSFSVEEALGDRSLKAVEDFAGRLSLVSGKESAVGDASHAAVRFEFDSGLGKEAYSISSRKKGVTVKASAFNGVFYAIQTIKQLLPAEIFGSTAAADSSWTIPQLDIEDAPRFAYRGLLLDCCRHFFPLEEVKKMIDMMSVEKMNCFQWHLNDDQGWRIEIKKYPRLTEFGSIRQGYYLFGEHDPEDTEIYGGFYTQEQIREVIEYAADRAVTVIPEIDMPGHMQAALASYPYLGCTGGPYEVKNTSGAGQYPLCVGRESTFQFVFDVLDEVMDLFPSEYIHVGGDECKKWNWEQCEKCQAVIAAQGFEDGKLYTAEEFLQSWFEQRVFQYLADHGRQGIGWEEIIQGNTITCNPIAVHWYYDIYIGRCANADYRIIRADNRTSYFDYYNSPDTEKEPLSIGSLVMLSDVYKDNPLVDLPANKRHLLFGVQCCLWSEFIDTGNYLEYMTEPRLAAKAEVAWTEQDNKDWNRFKEVISAHRAVFEQKDFNYCKVQWGIHGK